ncbi:hypothetical protein BTW00_09805 [Psychrobacter sp. C 20.9]|uniref:hypothetical protein n=1 Tax=Psychrobacter sp. C 20.9 TaxID=1926477 RepID=UPI000946A4E0|nr:hypothetical protein [Psychrobacter sp. C 20.9]OLF35223.1 hypothetical protein BTW00_09805 [Psychrobacter sp. C 20.9]
MNQFFKINNPREKHKNFFRLNYYIERSRNSTIQHFKNNFEYVVVWYEKEFITLSNADDAIIYVNVIFANLTQPTYLKETKGGTKESTSYLTVSIPVNYIHKLPFGSIWKNGKSKERFSLDTYEVLVDNNYEIYSYSKANRDMKYSHEEDRIRELPFDTEQYFDKIISYDKSQLINIKGTDQDFVIHPLSLFIIHYGYSTDIKRIITKYSLEDIFKRLIIEDKDVDVRMKARGIEEYVILPLNFTQRDSVFLHELKYNNDVKEKVRAIHNAVQLDKTSGEATIKIDFWHKPLTIRLKGIRIGGKVLCANIINIDEPDIAPVNFVVKPKRKLSIGNSKESQDVLNVRQHTVPDNVEDIDFTDNQVNNLGTLLIVEKIEHQGRLVTINRIIDIGDTKIRSIDRNTKFVKAESPQSFSLGDKHGNGFTGLANTRFEVEGSPKSQSRFARIWENAKAYAEEHQGNAQWFTFDQGFKSIDELSMMSLTSFHEPSEKNPLPHRVLVIEIKMNEDKYYLLEFGQVKFKNSDKLKGFNGIVYKADIDEDFTSRQGLLLNILMRVALLNGTLTYEFPDLYEGKLALFKHHEKDTSDWVKNGIENLL